MYCTNCGKEIAPDAGTTCPECGAMLSVPQPARATGFTRGRKVSALGALIVLLFFFAPWIKGCNRVYSGADLVMDPSVGDRFIFLMVPFAALVCLGAILFTRNSANAVKASVARWNILLAGIGIMPVWDIVGTVLAQKATALIEFQVGLFATLAGFLGVGAGGILDLKRGVFMATLPLFRGHELIFCSNCGTENPVENQHCRECGAALITKRFSDARPVAADTVRTLHIVTAVLAGLFATLCLLGGVAVLASSTNVGLPREMSVVLIGMGVLLGGGIALSFAVRDGNA